MCLMLDRRPISTQEGLRGITVSRDLIHPDGRETSQSMSFTYRMLDSYLDAWVDERIDTSNYRKSIREAAAVRIARASFDAEADAIETILRGPKTQPEFKTTRTPSPKREPVKRPPLFDPTLLISQIKKTTDGLAAIGLYSEPMHQACVLLQTQYRLLKHYREKDTP